MMQRTHGFTLIELMITVAVLGILILLGLPSYKQWMQNTQIRNATESILNGLQLARAEAVKRNTAVQFTLGAGTDWTVSVVSGGAVVQSRKSQEGSANVTLTVSPAGAQTVTFGSLGRVVPNADGSISLEQIDVDVPTTILPANKSRDLRLTIGAGGQIRMCDPDPGIQTGDPRKC